MKRENSNGDRFDQYIREEVDRVTYSFDPGAWSALNDMLDGHTPSLSKGGSSWWTWLMRYWWVLVSGVLAIALGVSLMISSNRSDFGIDQGNTPDENMATSVVMDSATMDKNEVISPGRLVDEEIGETGSRNMIRTKVQIEPIKPLRITILEHDYKVPGLEPWVPMSRQDLLENLKKWHEEERKKYMIW